MVFFFFSKIMLQIQSTQLCLYFTITLLFVYLFTTCFGPSEPSSGMENNIKTQRLMQVEPVNN
jgi:hypothetical protein